MTKKIQTFIPYIVLILVTAVVIFLLGQQRTELITEKEYEVIVSQAVFPADYSDNRNLVGGAHNIFIGTVTEQTGTKARSVHPETQFEVEVIDNIKGGLKGKTIVNQLGGYKDGKLYVSEGDMYKEESEKESLLQIGSTYLFTTRYNPNENWNTLLSYPSANKLLTSREQDSENLRELAREDDRVNELKEAYPNEVLIKADVVSGNAHNSFKDIVVEEKEGVEVEKTTETNMIPSGDNSTPSVESSVASSSADLPKTL